MPSALSKRIDDVNTELAALLTRTSGALSEAAPFTVDDVRALSRPISEMAPILAAAKTFPQAPEIAAKLHTYKAHLRDLQPALENLRLMLLAKRSKISSGQTQIQAVSNWTAALSATNEP